MWHCIEVDWPAKSLLRWFDRRTSWPRPVSWMGSLLQHGRDPSGQYYPRKRVEPFGRIHHLAASAAYGEIHGYTGIF